MTDGPLRRLLGLARRAAADPTDDARLLARFAAGGDADAFELLVWRHGALVLGVCRRVLGDDHAAEDAFQATFLALARQAGSVRGCVPGWLHRVARRVAVRARRATVRRAWHEGRAVAAPACDATAPTADLQAVLDEELDRLPERFRRAVVLCYLEGQSTAEAARRLGCPRGTVLSRLATAREKLRVRLLRRGVAPAILPPVIHGGLSDAPAALVAPAVRAAVAGAAAPRVIELCDGVLRAMMLSKLKLTAAVVLTVGMIGGGAGWVALTPGGPGTAFADPPAAKTAGKPDAPPPDRKAAEDHAQQMRVELEKAENQLADQEERWMQERAEFRGMVIEAEERLRQLERERESQQAMARARLQSAAAAVQQARAEIQDLDHGHLSKDHPDFKRKEARFAYSQKDLSEARDLYDRQEALFTKRVIDARRQAATAEDRLSLHDRLTAGRRQHLQYHRDGLLGQMLQHHGLTARPDGGMGRLAEVDRKLDELKREIVELRRELKK